MDTASKPAPLKRMVAKGSCRNGVWKVSITSPEGRKATATGNSFQRAYNGAVAALALAAKLSGGVH